MPETTERQKSPWGLIMVMMFLFGGTVGYIARDIRADEQIKQAAAQARLDVQQASLETFQRLERAGQAIVRGVSATAESTRAAVREPPARERSDQSLSTPAKDSLPKR